ncbi:MAG: hypothetical protein U1F43_26490 [Myxococcota bacterium]
MQVHPDYPPIIFPPSPHDPEPRSPWRARVSASRPMEAILFERTLPDGGNAALSALIDRRTGELAFVGEALGLATSELEELRGLARGGTEGLQPIELEHARLRLARALLASRIAGRPAPAWLMARADLVGDPCHPASRIDDIYLCARCDAALPPSEQLAFAYREGKDHALMCPTCRGDATPRSTVGADWQDRAWLMLAADLPHRALVCAARAEAARLPHGRLDLVRGLAHLRLGQGQQALVHFRRAAGGRTPDRRLAVWIERAHALVAKTTPVRLDAERDRTVPAPMPGHASARAIGPVPAFA